MNPLQKLQTLGQSPWQDNISRDQLVSGMLQDMVNDGDITGLHLTLLFFSKLYLAAMIMTLLLVIFQVWVLMQRIFFMPLQVKT